MQKSKHTRVRVAIILVIITLLLISIIPGVLYVPCKENQIVFFDSEKTQHIAPCKSLKLDAQGLRLADGKKMPNMIEIRKGKGIWYIPWQPGQYIYYLNQHNTKKYSKHDLSFDGFAEGHCYIIKIVDENTIPIWYIDVQVKENLFEQIYYYGNFPLGTLLLFGFGIVVVLFWWRKK